MKPYNFHFFGPVLISIYLAFHFYFALWLGRYFILTPKQSRVFKPGLCLLALALPAAEYCEKLGRGSLSDAVIWAGFFWLGAMTILVTVLVFCDLFYLLLRIVRAARPHKRTLGIVSLTLAAGLILLALWQGAAIPKVVTLDITLRNLPPGLDGFKVVQISDLHLGRIITTERFRKIAARINALEPDLVVFTGDLTERGNADSLAVSSIIRSIHSKYGMAAVLGNHDFFSGTETADTFYPGCGVKLLRSEKYEPAAGLQVAGTDYPRRGALPARPLAALVAELDTAKPVVFLSHRPEGFDPVMKAGSGLILSGHTHAGQLFQFGLLERPLFKYFYGLYRLGDFTIYVTSGAGTWGPPLRLFTSSELPLFILHPAK
ncbi:MAG: metallophosphoesterase [Elusimicrobia bacterium]|nr:metallophosphoesterase [Elusimicrobiota bacterium]